MSILCLAFRSFTILDQSLNLLKIVRQHVNPLSRFFQNSFDLPMPVNLFKEESLPIHLDIGSAKGKFLTEMALMEPEWNFLGVEIRKPLVDFAESTRQELDLENLGFVFCNANVSLSKWLIAIQPESLRRVSIQFPDPWFKKRHRKRRVLQPDLLFDLSRAMPAGAELFIQSDVLHIMDSMINLIEISNCFDPVFDGPFLDRNINPFTIPTEREEYALENNLKVYRMLYKRNNQNPSSLIKHKSNHNIIRD